MLYGTTSAFIMPRLKTALALLYTNLIEMDVLVEGVKLSNVHVHNIDTSEYQQLINSAVSASVVLFGTGRFGLIYRTDWRDRTVAIKTFVGPSSDVGRQRNELLFHAIANHPNIVRILAAGPDFPKRCQFYMMEYATGSSLNEGQKLCVLFFFRSVSRYSVFQILPVRT
ncbi:hypothetical protein X801_06095, partial [Opisthorchis viverrini]